MKSLRITTPVTALLNAWLLTIGCSSSDPGIASHGVGGAPGIGGATSGGAPTIGGSNPGTGGNATEGGSVNGGSVGSGGISNTFGGKSQTGGVPNAGGSTSSATGGTAMTGGSANGGSVTTGGKASTGGVSAAGGTLTTGGAIGVAGTVATGGTSSTGTYACDGTTTGYNATMIKSGSTWTVTNAGSQKYSGTDTTLALKAAYDSLTTGRTSKQSVLVQGDGDIPATSLVQMPSYLILNWCGTLNVSGTPATSGDQSPLRASGKTDIEIPNLKMTGTPAYGLFFRGTSNIILGNIDLRLSAGSGIGIRVDTSGSAQSETTFVKNLQINKVYGSGMDSHVVETYGVDGVQIGTVEGSDVGECGLLLNRSINAEVDLVTCNNCAHSGTLGYAAFRVANYNGMIGSSYPEGNIHVKKVYARGGGRGIFSVTACGGLTIDSIDIASTGNTPILLQNTYNTTIAAVSGTVSSGLVQLSNDTKNTDAGMVASQNVSLRNLVLSNGASVRQDWCELGARGCTATNITGGTVSMCN